MKKLTSLLLCVALCGALVFAGGSGDKDKKLVNVRIGIHGNECGAIASAAQNHGFFTKYGINPVYTIVESGPVEMTAMRADNRTLDVGFIGAGVAWNPLDGVGNGLSFVFFDSLSNSEKLLAKKGVFVDANKNGKFDNEEIFTGLKGKIVYIEVGTTPGGWFKNLVELLNKGTSDSEKLWISCETAAYMAGYMAANSNPANKVTVVNTQNLNLPAGMASGGMSIVAGFAPATSGILRTNSSVEIVATTVESFPPEMSFASTWVASTTWLKENPEVAQNFINALYEAAVWRADNIEQSMREGEKLVQKPINSFDPTNIVMPTKAEYEEWFATKDSLGYTYMRALYESRIPNVPKGNLVKSFEEAFTDSYMINAIYKNK